MTLYCAAYHDQHNAIQMVGTPCTDLELTRAVVRHANRDDQAVRFFVAFAEEPPWQELGTLPTANVTLPPPDSTRYEGDEHEHVDRLSWRPAHDIEVSVWHPGEVQIGRLLDFGWEAEEPVDADTARKFGLTLLAAADAAERQS